MSDDVNMPTTEEVRAVWCDFREHSGRGARETPAGWNDRKDAFDRWLAEAAQAERVAAEAWEAGFYAATMQTWRGNPHIPGNSHKTEASNG